LSDTRNDLEAAGETTQKKEIHSEEDTAAED
jgi:hypothetical protein